MDITGFQTLRVTRTGPAAVARLDRPERRNALNASMIEELHAFLDATEAAGDVRALVIAGDAEAFCDGMDFVEASRTEVSDRSEIEATVRAFWRLLVRFTRSQKVVIALVEGPVNAGGMGLVAASDVAIAGPKASFGLSEVLFGLLPATVAPFLIRRMGFQAAYRLALTAQRIDAETALRLQLVDELASVPEEALRRLLLRVARIGDGTTVALKRYFEDLWLIDERTEDLAVRRIAERIADPSVMEGIRSFVTGEGVPWRKP